MLNFTIQKCQNGWLNYPNVRMANKNSQIGNMLPKKWCFKCQNIFTGVLLPIKKIPALKLIWNGRTGLVSFKTGLEPRAGIKYLNIICVEVKDPLTMGFAISDLSGVSTKLKF